MITALPIDVAGTLVDAATPVAGGDICRAFRVELADGRTVFVKTHDDPHGGFFAAEADGLRGLAAAGASVPAVLDQGERWLALDWIEVGPWRAAVEEDAGRAVAMLHAAGAPSFGYERDGFVGTVPVDNTPVDDWLTFWAERRLRPLVSSTHGHQLHPLLAHAVLFGGGYRARAVAIAGELV